MKHKFWPLGGEMSDLSASAELLLLAFTYKYLIEMNLEFRPLRGDVSNLSASAKLVLLSHVYISTRYA